MSSNGGRNSNPICPSKFRKWLEEEPKYFGGNRNRHRWEYILEKYRDLRENRHLGSHIRVACYVMNGIFPFEGTMAGIEFRPIKGMILDSEGNDIGLFWVVC